MKIISIRTDSSRMRTARFSGRLYRPEGGCLPLGPGGCLSVGSGGGRGEGVYHIGVKTLFCPKLRLRAIIKSFS